MCEICRQTPCHPQCPNADEPKPVKVCSWCDAELFLGDDVFKIGDEEICTECIESCKTTIEEEERDE